MKFIKHIEQVFNKASIDKLAVSFSLNEHEQAVDTARLYDRIGDYVLFEEVQTKIPYGQYERIVEDVATIEWQEDLTDHVHLRAVVLPMRVEQLQILDLIVHFRENFRKKFN